MNLRESLAVNDVITTVEAHDADSASFGEIRYFVPKRGNSRVARALVRVDPMSGGVYLRQQLNHAKHDG